MFYTNSNEQKNQQRKKQNTDLIEILLLCDNSKNLCLLFICRHSDLHNFSGIERNSFFI